MILKFEIDVLPFYLAINEEFLRAYLVPSRGAVWVTQAYRCLDCHLVEEVWYIYDWDTFLFSFFFFLFPSSHL